jgi:hypothetical protein
MFWNIRARRPQNTRRRKMRKAARSLEILEERSLLSVFGYPGPPPGGSPPSTPPMTPPTTPPIVTPPPSTTPTPPSRTPVPPPVIAPIARPVPMPTPPPARPPFRVQGVNGSNQQRAPGVVRKAPHFYEVYTGPKLAELNAIGASAKLTRGGKFVFTGTNQGRIRVGPAVYVWGIDRNGNLGPGPFTNRPNIKFDAVVVVTLDTSHHVSAQVVDLTNGNTTDLPGSSAKIRGSTVSVTVPSRLLPSTGLSLAHYRFNYWPEDGGPPVSSSIASFAPEFTTAQVGVSR